MSANELFWATVWIAGLLSVLYWAGLAVLLFLIYQQGKLIRRERYAIVCEAESVMGQIEAIRKSGKCVTAISKLGDGYFLISGF